MNFPRKVCIYNNTKEKINFVQIKRFILSLLGDTFVEILSEDVIKNIVVDGLLLNLIRTEKRFSFIDHRNICCIVITDKLFATLDRGKRIHIRASIYSYPSIISTAGIVEGPAKERIYYFYKQRFASLGIWELKRAEIKKRLKGEFIDYGDNRFTEVIKGYIAQALFFYIWGNPFCERKYCRLYNAHWQKELVYSQVKSGKFCAKHTRMLDRLRRERERE